MRKKYETPKLYYEQFSLSSQIASCVNTAIFEMNGCPVSVPELGGATIFLNNGICDFYTPNVDDMICYHVPTDDMSVFTS